MGDLTGAVAPGRGILEHASRGGADRPATHVLFADHGEQAVVHR